MKPLIRWTIGPVLPAGFKTLRIAVGNMKMIYGDSFDYLVCHNQLSSKQINILEKLDCKLYKQQGDEFPIPPTIAEYSKVPSLEKGTKACWKLYPPRFSTDRIEFIIDNDLIICERIQEFDDAVAGKLHYPVLCEGERRRYGFFDSIVHGDMPMNNGLIGLPAGFDFEDKLKANLPESWSWTSYFDDQGLTAAALQQANLRVISRREIDLIEPYFEVPPRKGYHFVMVNYAEEHIGWKKFSKNLIKLN